MILNFSEWMEQSTVGTEFVDESKIDQIYIGAKKSVQIVQMYDKMTGQKLLTNINTILPLSSGSYGLYMSAENKKVIGGDVLNKLKLIFPKDTMLSQKIQTIPNAIIKKYIPDLDEKKIQPSDTIHVNIQKILNQFGDSPQAILEIASTIVHEATHEIELQTTGKTNEIGPMAAEKKFMDWVKQNWRMLSQRFGLSGSV